MLAFLLRYKFVFFMFGIFLSFCFLLISTKKNEINNLKNKIIELQDINYKLLVDLKTCENKIFIQNEAIKKQEIIIKEAENTSLNKIRNVYIKDKSCLSELEAYKRLFDEN